MGSTRKSALGPPAVVVVTTKAGAGVQIGASVATEGSGTGGAAGDAGSGVPSVQHALRRPSGAVGAVQQDAGPQQHSRPPVFAERGQAKSAPVPANWETRSTRTAIQAPGRRVRDGAPQVAFI